jgi:hypothetical protein
VAPLGPAAGRNAAHVLDVVHSHQFAVITNHGEWQVLEAQALRRAKAEIERLNAVRVRLVEPES